MNFVNYKTADSQHTLTSRAGLVAFAELVKQLKLTERVDQLMPKGAHNRAFRSSAIFNTFMLMLHDGAKCLDDVRLLQRKSALLRLFGINKLPHVHAIRASNAMQPIQSGKPRL